MDKKGKSGRFQVKCLTCGAEFNRDYKTRHEKKRHDGKYVQIKMVGAPENPFVSAASAKRQKTETLPSTSFAKGMQSD